MFNSLTKVQTSVKSYKHNNANLMKFNLQYHKHWSMLQCKTRVKTKKIVVFNFLKKHLHKN